MYPPCDAGACALGLADCWARRDVAAGTLCEFARRGHVAYSAEIRRRSDPAYRPPPAPPPEATPPPPQPTVGLPDCPDRGPKVDDAGCLTFMCKKFTRVVSGCECGRCAANGYAYVG